MKKWILGLIAVLIVTSGMAYPAYYPSQIEKASIEVCVFEYDHLDVSFEPVQIYTLIDYTIASEIEVNHLSATRNGNSWVDEMTLKVPVYSVPLPAENKIVLVRDPKGFVERAIRHNMEYLAIKPSDKGEFWELMPVFSNEEGGLSFSLNKSDEPESEESEEEPLRIVPVKDFIRYN